MAIHFRFNFRHLRELFEPNGEKIMKKWNESCYSLVCNSKFEKYFSKLRIQQLPRLLLYILLYSRVEDSRHSNLQTSFTNDTMTLHFNFNLLSSASLDSTFSYTIRLQITFKTKQKIFRPNSSNPFTFLYHEHYTIHIISWKFFQFFDMP